MFNMVRKYLSLRWKNFPLQIQLNLVFFSFLNHSLFSKLSRKQSNDNSFLQHSASEKLSVYHVRVKNEVDIVSSSASIEDKRDVGCEVVVQSRNCVPSALATSCKYLIIVS